MKRLLLAIIVFLGGASQANALSYTGEFMFTISGNDNDPFAISTEINSWFSTNSITHDPVSLSFYAKVDEPATSNGDLTITYDSGNKTGTWSTLLPIEFYSVKGGKEFAMYWIESIASSGTWSTEHLLNGGGNIPAISHFSAWSPSPVPEPATMLLMGTGLVGVVGSRLRRKKKA